jgi:6-phosphogluconolactonase
MRRCFAALGRTALKNGAVIETAVTTLKPYRLLDVALQGSGPWHDNHNVLERRTNPGGGIMITRRTFMSFLAPTAVAPDVSWPQGSAARVALYASVGPTLTRYDVDVSSAELSWRDSVTLPANVQYAWPHVSRQYLYVASSNSSPGLGGVVGDTHHVNAFRLDGSGALTPHGQPIPLPSRPIHLTTDRPSEYVLVAFNNPSAIRVYRINRDATLGEEVQQPGPIDAGIFAHQVCVTDDNRLAILVTRGNDPAGGKPEDPGALKVFAFRDGLLTNEVSVAPHGGYGFGPRHLDFHPSRPWIYVSLERENKLDMFTLDGEALSTVPRFRKETLARPDNTVSRQAAGTVHVHPNGRFVYGVNRADTTTDFEGKPVFVGGENTIATYLINQETGEPTLIDHTETHGIHCRTFHIDPSGRMLVAAHIRPMFVREGAGVRQVPACLSVFRIGHDGKLDFVRTYDVDVGNHTMFWMGMVKL